MLNPFRNNKQIQNVILIIIVLLLGSYVLVSFGTAPPVAQSDTIASVGSVDIKLADAWIQQENVMSRFRQLDRENLLNFSAAQLLSDAVLIHNANELGLVASDAELFDTIVRYRTMEDGSFVDDERWSAFISKQYRVQVSTYEQFVRDHALRTQKLRDLFYSSSVSEKAISERFARDNQKVKIEMISLGSYEARGEIKLDKDEEVAKLVAENPDSFRSGDQRQIRFISVPFSAFEAKATVSDEEVKQNYEANISRYQRGESVKASHILVKTDKRSEAEAQALIEKIKKELDGGLDFAEAAKKYSEDEGSKVRGGDLGTFMRGAMVKAFEDAAFSMAVNTVSAPVKSEFGFHLIKKFEATAATTRPLEEVRTIIVNTIKRDKTKGAAMEAANAFHAKLDAGVDFAAAAKELGYEVKTSDFFDNDNRSFLGEDLKMNFQARKAAFELQKLQDVSAPITMGNEVVVMQWVAEQGPRVLTMDKDAQRIRQLAQDVAATAFIKAELNKIREAALKEPAKSLKDLRGNRSWLKDNSFTTTDWVDVNTLPYDLRKPTLDFSKEIYALEVGQFLPSLETSSDTRFALARVIDKQEPDQTKLEEARHQIIATLSQESGTDLMAAYMWAQRESVDKEGKIQEKLVKALQGGR